MSETSSETNESKVIFEKYDFISIILVFEVLKKDFPTIFDIKMFKNFIQIKITPLPLFK